MSIVLKWKYYVYSKLHLCEVDWRVWLTRANEQRTPRCKMVDNQLQKLPTWATLIYCHFWHTNVVSKLDWHGVFSRKGCMQKGTASPFPYVIAADVELGDAFIARHLRSQWSQDVFSRHGWIIHRSANRTNHSLLGFRCWWCKSYLAGVRFATLHPGWTWLKVLCNSCKSTPLLEEDPCQTGCTVFKLLNWIGFMLTQYLVQLTNHDVSCLLYSSCVSSSRCSSCLPVAFAPWTSKVQRDIVADSLGAMFWRWLKWHLPVIHSMCQRDNCTLGSHVAVLVRRSDSSSLDVRLPKLLMALSMTCRSMLLTYSLSTVTC